MSRVGHQRVRASRSASERGAGSVPTRQSGAQKAAGSSPARSAAAVVNQVNPTLAALKGIAGYARDLNLLTAEDYDRLRRVKRARGERLPAGRAVLPGELGTFAVVQVPL